MYPPRGGCPAAEPPRLITVVYDGAAAACQRALQTVHSREASLPGRTPTVRLVAWPSREAEEVLACIDGQLRERNLGEEYRIAGKMVAVLPSGLVLSDCHSDVMQLVYEMESMSLVQPPSLQVTARIDACLAPLDALRRAGHAGTWWRSRQAFHLVADALQDVLFCILDDFLPAEAASRLAAAVHGSRPPGPIPVEGRNGWTRGATARAAEAISAEGDYEARNERLARALVSHTRGDILKYSDDDNAMPGTEALCASVDALVMGLKGCEQVAERLVNTDFANSTMCSVYPGGASRYIKHTDNSVITDGRRLTAILYLNEAWEPKHGGQLRIFEPTMQSTRVKRDVEPLFNRLLIFWSTEEVPHEVLSSFRDRAAASIWYVCARECLQTEDAFKRLAAKCRTIGGQDKAERMAAAGETPEQRRLLRALGAADESALSAEDAAERRAVLAAVAHDFGGCERHRRQRDRLNAMFGWDARLARVERELAAAQLQHLELFERMGLPRPPGLRDSPSLASTAPPALTEEYVRRHQQELRSCRTAALAGCGAAEDHAARSLRAIPALFPGGVRQPMPRAWELVD